MVGAAQVLLHREREPGKILQFRQVIGLHPRRVELGAVEGQVRAGVSERAPQAPDLERRVLVARRRLDRIERSGPGREVFHRASS
jgi:hypothetical protein